MNKQSIRATSALDAEQTVACTDFIYICTCLLPCLLLKLLNDNSLLQSSSASSYFSKLNPEIVKDVRLMMLCLPASDRTAELQPTQRTNSTAYYCRQTLRGQPPALPATSQSQEPKGSLPLTRLIV